MLGMIVSAFALMLAAGSPQVEEYDSKATQVNNDPSVCADACWCEITYPPPPEGTGDNFLFFIPAGSATVEIYDMGENPPQSHGSRTFSSCEDAKAYVDRQCGDCISD